MINLAKDYPVVAAFFAKHAAEWAELNQDAAIVEALDAIDDKGHYELPSCYTISGRPETLDSAE